MYIIVCMYTYVPIDVYLHRPRSYDIETFLRPSCVLLHSIMELLGLFCCCVPILFCIKAVVSSLLFLSSSSALDYISKMMRFNATWPSKSRSKPTSCLVAGTGRSMPASRYPEPGDSEFPYHSAKLQARAPGRFKGNREACNNVAVSRMYLHT